MEPTRPSCCARPNPRNSPCLILVCGCIFSFGPLLFRNTTVHPDDGLAWRYLFWRFVGLCIAGMAWIIITVGCRGWRIQLTRRRAFRSAIGAALMCGCNICFIVALARVDTATTLLLQSCAPFSAALLGWLVRRERVDIHTWCSMFLAVVGVALMGSEWRSSDPVGLSAAIGIAVLLGAYAVVLRGKGEAAPEPRMQFSLNGLIGVAIVFVVVCSSYGIDALRFPAVDTACALTAGGVVLGSGIPLYQVCGEHVTPARTTLLLLSEVVVRCRR